MSPPLKNPKFRAVALVGVILGALLIPRVWALRGMELTSDLQFADTLSHLLNLDRLTRAYTLDAAQLADPFLQQHPGVLKLNNQANWPPGLYHVAYPAAAIFGTMSIWTTQLVNLLFYGVLLVGVFGLGRLLGGWRVGFWAALLTALCPALVAASWYFTIDFPLVGMAAVGLLLLWYTRDYDHPWFTLLFAIWAAAGMLIKFTYALYLAVPCLIALYRALWRGPRRWRALLHLGLATAVVLGLVWLGHGVGLRYSLDTLAVHLSSEIPDPNPDWTFVPISPWSVKGVLAVAAYTAMNFPLPLVLLALPGLVLLHRAREQPARFLLLGLFWGVYVSMTLMVHRQERYIQPMYPVLCLVTAWWVLTHVKRRWRVVVMLWVTTTYGGVLYVAQQHTTPWYYDGKTWPTTGNLEMPGAGRLDALREFVYHPECRYKPVVRAIVEMAKKEGTRRPLGLSNILAEGDTQGEQLTLMVAQHIRDRHLYWYHIPRWHSKKPPPPPPPPPALIMLHRAGADLSRLRVPAEAVRSRMVKLECPGGSERAAVTLFRPWRGPGKSGTK